MHWYTEEELFKKIEQNNHHEIWFRLVLLETMIFEPYFSLGTETDEKGIEKPSEKFKVIQGSLNGFSKRNGDAFFESFFKEDYYPEGYVRRLRRTYNRLMFELNEVKSSLLKAVTITSLVTIATAASLAYIGGGAIAAGRAGMAGGDNGNCWRWCNFGYWCRSKCGWNRRYGWFTWKAECH